MASGIMEDSLLDSLAQSMLETGGLDFPLSNGDLDFSLPAELYSPLPELESLSNDNSDPARARSSDIPTERLVDVYGREQSVEQPASGSVGFGPPAATASLSAAPGPGQQFFHQQQAQPPQQQQQRQAQQTNGFVQQLQHQQSFQNGAAPPDLRAGSMSSGEFYGAADNGSGRHSSGSGGPAPAPEEAQEGQRGSDEYDKVNNHVLKFKEKNRAAQRRYRERQKEKLQVSEERVAQLTEELQKMRIEQETLAQRNSMLEKLLSMQQAAASQKPTPTGTRSAIEAQKDAWWLDAQMKVYMEDAFHLGGELVFTVRKDAPLRMTQAQVAEMTEAEFDTLWKQYMNAFAVLLIEAGGDQDTAPGRRLARLVYEGGQLKGSMLVSYPDRIHYKLASNNVCPGGVQRNGKTSDEVWSSMADSARLSEEQRGAIVALRRLYLRNLGVLSRRRQALTSLLQTELPMSGACGGPTLASDTYGKTLSTMDSLRDTLRDEHTCLLQFMLTVWRRVLTPMQVAHMNVTSYPGHTDILRIAEVMAKQAGEPMSCSIMKAAAAEPDAAELLPVDYALPKTMRPYTSPPLNLTELYPHLPMLPPAPASQGAPTEAAIQLSSGSFGQSGDSTTTSSLAAVKVEAPDASADVHSSPSSAGGIAAGQQRKQVAAR